MRTPLASSTLLRHSIARSTLRKNPGTRFNSTSPTEKKAQDALADAQKVATKAWDSTIKFLGPVGNRIGNLLGGYKQPLIYNFAVAREVVKKIYLTEALQPPSLSQLTAAYRYMWSNATQAAYWRGLIPSGQVGQLGVYGLQAYGLFKIGEILGRRRLVGYPVH